MEAAECGAAALTMVLGYWGKHLPLDEVRQACGVSRDGSNAASMLKAARHYGLEARGYRLEVAALEQYTLPAIVHWEFNHFLVVERFARKWVYLADPARGYRRVIREEFDASFTGIALIFQPGPAFVPGDSRPPAFRQILSLMAGARYALALVGAASLLITLIGFGVPLFTQVFLDNVFIDHQLEWRTVLLWSLAAVVALQYLASYVRERLLVNIRIRLGFGMFHGFVDHLISLPISFFTERGTGDLMARVSLNNTLRQLLSDDLVTALLDIALVFLYLVLMFFYDLTLALVALAAAALNIAAIALVNRTRVNQNELLLSETAKQRSAEMAALRMIETLKSTGSEDEVYSRWRGLAVNATNYSQKFGLLNLPLQTIPVLASAVVTGLVLWIGGGRIIGGMMTVGMVMAFLALQASFLAPVNRLVSFAGSLQQIKGCWERIQDVLRAKPCPAPARPAALDMLSGRIELRNVTFGYNPVAPPLIEQLSISIHPGQRIALVGASGSGKSTIANLITGILSPNGGQVLYDGVDLRDADLETLRRQIGIVNQQSFLFAGTVRNNLTLWEEDVPHPDLVRAVQDACLDEEIRAMANGLDTALEEDGANLSGGQKQRLCLARALVRNPSILLLDEATSSLDTLTEEQIDRNLQRRGCTCVIIAHRLSTIRTADEILVLEGGKIVERGTHRDLVGRNGIYAALIRTS